MDFLIVRNKYFNIEHSYSCAVPGYLIVSPTSQTVSINSLPLDYQHQLGVYLAKAVELIQKVIDPYKVYCAQFGEEASQLHFHIFPRTNILTAAFLDEFPEQHDLIHGPVLLDWARAKYKRNSEDVWSSVSSVISEMKRIVGEKY